MRGEKIQIAQKVGHHRRFAGGDDGPALNAGYVFLWFFRGSRPVLLRNPIFFIPAFFIGVH